MGYFDNKDSLIEHANFWYERMEDELHDKTEESVKNSKIYYQGDAIGKPFTITWSYDTDIIIEPLTTVEAILKYKLNYKDEKIAALNFASYKNPGGMFLKGSSAQEESLCHASNLYNILKRLEDGFYVPNLKRLNNALYNSNLIYTPQVYFDGPEMGTYCDIITCAAPNRTAAKRYKSVPDTVINEHMEDRIDHVLSAALLQRVDVLILGAFGCGVFGNEPKVVARLFKKFLETDYKNCFKKVIFAIPAGKNYDKFKEIFDDE